MSTRIKAFDAGGFNELISQLKTTKKAADSATSDLADVKKDVEDLAEKVTNVLIEIGEAIETLDTTKAYVDARKSFSLALGSWVSDASNAKYPYKYTLTIPKVNADSTVDAVLDADSTVIAGSAGMCPTTTTAANTVVFRSRKVPSAALTGTLYITQGASSATA